MKQKRTTLTMFVALSILLLASGCQRSASAPPAPASIQDSAATTEGTPPPMEALELISTQTAVAAMGGAVPMGEVVPPTEAPTPEPPAAPANVPAPTDTPQPPPPAQPQEAQGGGQQESANLDFPVPDTYTLQRGEFPFCIARRFDIAPSALLAANGLSTSSVTYPGTVLKIPKDAPHYNLGSRALRNHPTTYTVQAGDTVYSIACLFGDVDPRAIEAVNGLQGSYTLTPGQTLQIP
ncbi:MAG: LysM domain-containing protein [Anaerolineae bacterium]|nr:MAG: LysM domain-containing protein [Anaerolineae bacterium]